MTFDDWNGSVSVIRIYIHRIYNTHRIYTLDNGLLGNNSTYVTIREKRKRKKRNKTKQKRKKQRWNRCAQLSLSPLGNTTSFLSFLSLSLFLSSRPFFHARFSERKEKKFCLAPERKQSRENISKRTLRSSRRITRYTKRRGPVNETSNPPSESATSHPVYVARRKSR